MSAKPDLLTKPEGEISRKWQRNQSNYCQRLKKIASGVASFWGRGGSNEFYPGGADDQRRFGRGKLARDIAELMEENRQKMLLGDSRYIYQSFSTVSGAVKQKANYVYGNAWRLQSYSADAQNLLWPLKKILNKIDRLLDTSAAHAFSFRKSAWLGSKTIDVDGDYFIVLTENAETGFPKLQFLEAHRVGSFGLNGGAHSNIWPIQRVAHFRWRYC